MRPLSNDERVVRNIHKAPFVPLEEEGVVAAGQSLLQLDVERSGTRGFFAFRMEPGAASRPHEHTLGEHFYIIEGDLQDHDGYEYVAGDLVYLKPGTIHNSTTRNGCTLIAYLETAEYTE